MRTVLTIHGLGFTIARAPRGNVWGISGWCVTIGTNTYDGFATKAAAIAHARGYFA